VVCKTPNVPLFFTQWSYHIRYDHDQHRRWRRRNGNVIVSVSASATPLSINQTTMDSSSRRLKTYQEVDLYTILTSYLAFVVVVVILLICCEDMLRYVFLVALMSFFTFSNLATYFSSWNKCYQVVKSAREKFTQEFSFQSKDKDISLAKVYMNFDDDLSFFIIFMIITWYLVIRSLFFPNFLSCV